MSSASKNRGTALYQPRATPQRACVQLVKTTAESPFRPRQKHSPWKRAMEQPLKTKEAGTWPASD